MTQKAREALKASIIKWEQNLEAAQAGDFDNVLTGWRSCPLCQLYADINSSDGGWTCSGCPIQQHTGHGGCTETPCEAVCLDPSVENVQAELDFLNEVLKGLEMKIFEITTPILCEPIRVCVICMTYAEGGLCVLLTDAVTGEPVAKVSIHVPGLDLPPDRFVCKNYSEGEGMDIALEAAGIARKTGATAKVGTGMICPIMELLEEVPVSGACGGSARLGKETEFRRTVKERDEMNDEEFLELLKVAADDLNCGDDPQDILEELFELEPDYLDDLLNELRNAKLL